MRINEIASATEQMELWKLISTNVWQAIDTQQKQEAQRQQAKKALTKTRRVRGGGVARKTTPAPMVPVKVSRNAVNPNAPTQPSSSPQAPTAINQAPYVNPSKPNTIAPVKSSAPYTQSLNPNANPQQLNKHPVSTLKPTPAVLPTVKTHKRLRDDDAIDVLKTV